MDVETVPEDAGAQVRAGLRLIALVTISISANLNLSYL